MPVAANQLIAYNQGQIASAGLKPGTKPSTPLVAIYPADGTLVADHPYVTLTATWVDQSKQDAAARFLAFLDTPEQQGPFLDAGLPDHKGTPGALPPRATCATSCPTRAAD